MRWDFLLFFASLVVTPLGEWGAYIGVAGMVIFGAHGILISIHDQQARKMSITFGLIVSGVLFAALLAFLLKPQWFGLAAQQELVPKTDTQSGQFSWNWGSLTAQQKENLLSGLGHIKKTSVVIGCMNQTCADLLNDLNMTFTQAGLTITGPHSLGVLYAIGVSGMAISGPEPEAGNLRTVLQDALGIPVSIRTTTYPPTPKDFVAIIVGGKEPPNPIPLEIQNQLLKLSNSMQILASDLNNFAVERQREKQRLPQLPRSHPPTQEQGFREWKQQTNFSQETSALLNQKYGARIASIWKELDAISIRPDFKTESSLKDSTIFAKWLNVVAEKLEKAKVVEARTIAADSEFWFDNGR